MRTIKTRIPTARKYSTYKRTSTPTDEIGVEPGTTLDLDPDESDRSSEFDTDLDETEETITQREAEKQQKDDEANKGTGSVTYEEVCKRLKIVPIRRITEQLPRSRMLLQHVGMNASQSKALACALWHNTCLESLDLEDNGLSGEGIVPLIDLLKANLFITSLSLCENEIEVVGAIALEEALRETTCLSHLNLSGTKLGDKEMEYISAGIQANRTLRWLDLSHNNISTNGSKKLGRAIGDTRSLQSLNLSWNHIRMEGAVGILKGLKMNTSLVSVDLSINGLGFEGSLQLEETLRENTTLRYLDISNNRINWEGVSYVAKGLKKNYTLHMLKIGSNPINMEGCYELLKAVAHKRSKVLHVGFENIPVNGAVLTVASDILKTRQFSITHGGILDTRDVVGIRKEKPEDPITLVVRYLATVGIRIIDLFRIFDSDNDGEVSVREFIRGLKRVGVPLPDRDMASVANRLDKEQKGYISYGSLSQGVRNHIREERKEDKRQEVKKRNRLEERRRILQTELPEIYKKTYEENLFMLYATQSTSNMHSPTQSLTTSMNSLWGSQMPLLPAIDSGKSSMVSSHSTSGENQPSDSSKNKATEAESSDRKISPMAKRTGSLKSVTDITRSLAFKRHSLSASTHLGKSYKMLQYVNAYLERTKTQAKFDLSGVLPN